MELKDYMIITDTAGKKTLILYKTNRISLKVEIINTEIFGSGFGISVSEVSESLNVIGSVFGYYKDIENAKKDKENFVKAFLNGAETYVFDYEEK